jgi:hypothetical protein
MKAIVDRLPITKARIKLGEVVRRAYTHREYFILEKDGIPVAGVLSADDMEDYLELQDAAVKDQIKKSYRDYHRGKARNASKFLAELGRSAGRSGK